MVAATAPGRVLGDRRPGGDRAATDRTAAEAIRILALASRIEQTRRGRRQAQVAAALARRPTRTRRRGGTR